MTSHRNGSLACEILTCKMDITRKKKTKSPLHNCKLFFQLISKYQNLYQQNTKFNLHKLYAKNQNKAKKPTKQIPPPQNGTQNPTSIRFGCFLVLFQPSSGNQILGFMLSSIVCVLVILSLTDLKYAFLNSWGAGSPKMASVWLFVCFYFLSHSFH